MKRLFDKEAGRGIKRNRILLVCALLVLALSFTNGGQNCPGAFQGVSGAPDALFTAQESLDVEAADTNGDSLPDVVFISMYGPLQGSGAPDKLYAGTGINWTDVTAARLHPWAAGSQNVARSGDAEFGDLDGDNVLDLVVATDGSNNLIYMGQIDAQGNWHGYDQSNYRFGDWSPFDSLDVELFDADNDGDLDIIFAVFGMVNQLYINQGGGIFSNATATNVIGAPADDTEDTEAADVDNDGDLDLVFANPLTPRGEQNRIWINQGGMQGGTLGIFVDSTAQLLPVAANCTVDVELADVDGDGDVDIYFSNSRPGGQQNRLLMNNGAGNFNWDATSTHLLPQMKSTNDAEFCDIDSDGDLDLFITNGLFTLSQGTSSEKNQLFLNDGTGRFLQEITNAKYLGDNLLSYDAEFMDMDGDGCCDLLIANYRHNYTSAPDWLLLNGQPASQPTGQVSIWVDRGCGSVYNSGDPITVQYRLSAPANVIVWDFDPRRVLQQLPVGYKPAGTHTLLSARTAGQGVETLVLQANAGSRTLTADCRFVVGASASLLNAAQVSTQRGCGPNAKFKPGEQLTVSYSFNQPVSSVRIFTVAPTGISEITTSALSSSSGTLTSPNIIGPSKGDRTIVILGNTAGGAAAATCQYTVP